MIKRISRGEGSYGLLDLFLHFFLYLSVSVLFFGSSLVFSFVRAVYLASGDRQHVTFFRNKRHVAETVDVSPTVA